MANLVVTATDLQTFLGLTTAIDNTRAVLMLQLAQDAASSILSPLPQSALGVVLSVAGRAYSNVQGVTAETIGPYSVQRPAGGVYLTKAEKTSLKTLGGRGGAFTVDPTPADAGTSLPVWDQNVYWPEGVPLLDDTAGSE